MCSSDLLVCGLGFAAIWVVVECLAQWDASSGTLPAVLLRGAVGGALFGVGMGAYYRHRARAMKLPQWCDYVPLTSSDAASTVSGSARSTAVETR